MALVELHVTYHSQEKLFYVIDFFLEWKLNHGLGFRSWQIFEIQINIKKKKETCSGEPAVSCQALSLSLMRSLKRILKGLMPNS